MWEFTICISHKILACDVAFTIEEKNDILKKFLEVYSKNHIFITKL